MHASHPVRRDPEHVILGDRAAKDDFFRHSPHSPIAPGERDRFVGLFYFPIDRSLRFEGLGLAPYSGEGPAEFAIPTSDGDMRHAVRAGELRFDIGGRELRLAVYDLGGDSLFVPFQDATSGSETYGAGRYLDLEPEPDGTYTLDFNLAYFPYCAYSPHFSCPLAPPENRLPVRVEAGERLPGAEVRA